MKFNDLNEEQLYEAVSDLEIILDGADVYMEDEHVGAEWTDPDKMDPYDTGTVVVSIPFNTILDRGMAVSTCVSLLEDCLEGIGSRDSMIDEIEDTIVELAEIESGSDDLDFETVITNTSKETVEIVFSFYKDIEPDYPEPDYY